jgi:hypothetical protein
MKRIPLFVFALATFSSAASAELRPDKVHVADAKKNLSYIRDGLFVGGDKAIDEVVVKDIRRAANPGGFERVVIDLEGSKNGEPAAIPRPPYYQVSVTPDEKRLVFTLWGKPKLGFDSNRVVAAFRKSSVIENVVLLPKVEDNTWTFVFELKGDSPVEVFELADPVRVIIDIKSSIPVKAAAAPHKPAKNKHVASKTHKKRAAHQSAEFHHSAVTHAPEHDPEEESALPVEHAVPGTEPATEGHEAGGEHG